MFEPAKFDLIISLPIYNQKFGTNEFLQFHKYLQLFYMLLRRLSQRAKGPDADILLFQIALLEDESFTNEIGDYIAAGAGAQYKSILAFNI